MAITDSFPVDGATLGANWTSQGQSDDFNVVSGKAQTKAGGPTDQSSYYSGVVFNADQTAQLTVVNMTAADGGGPTVRASGSGGSYNAYVLFYFPTSPKMSILKISGGSISTLQDNFGGPYTNGDIVKLEVTGGATPTLRMYLNGVQQGSDQTDASSPLTTGNPGMWCRSFSATTTFDDFVATGEVGGASGQPTSKRWGGVPFMRVGGPSFGFGGRW